MQRRRCVANPVVLVVLVAGDSERIGLQRADDGLLALRGIEARGLGSSGQLAAQRWACAGRTWRNPVVLVVLVAEKSEQTGLQRANDDLLALGGVEACGLGSSASGAWRRSAAARGERATCRCARRGASALDRAPGTRGDLGSSADALGAAAGALVGVRRAEPERIAPTRGTPRLRGCDGQRGL